MGEDELTGGSTYRPPYMSSVKKAYVEMEDDGAESWKNDNSEPRAPQKRGTENMRERSDMGNVGRPPGIR
jgi:hypothetical protein